MSPPIPSSDHSGADHTGDNADLWAAVGDEDVEPELTGTLVLITYRNERNGYTVAKIETEDGARETVVGGMPGVEVGDAVRVRGEWTTHASYGKQLTVETCEVRVPTGRRGLVRFLGGGRIKGVGLKTAESIVDTLGLDAIDRIEKSPALLSTVPGIGKERARAIAEQLREQRAASGALVFLQENGLGPAQSLRVFEAYGSETVQRVRDNPYRLADEIFGIGFRIADQLARKLGHEADSSFRIAAGLRHLLGRAGLEGHVGLPSEQLVGMATPFLEVDEQRVESVLLDSLQSGELVDDGLVYRPDIRECEQVVATRIRALLTRGTPASDVEPTAAIAIAEERQGFELAEDQRDALRVALTSQVAVITGGPGVGKTTIIRCLVDILRSQGLAISLAAPTGRAARRLAEATGYEASTLHRLLGLLPGGPAGFRTINDEALVTDVIIVDEVSMVDIALMSALVSQVPIDATLVLVGDVDQLPPVGPGEVLRDLIRSNAVPVARLSTIFRQAATSGIVRVAHELNDGRVPEFDPGPDGQAFFVERGDAGSALATIRQIVTQRIPQAFRLDPIRDVQVITPIHSGAIGTVALNEALRAALNPARAGVPEIERFGKTFRRGDKVMQVKNNYDLAVFNGDIGLLVDVDEDGGTVEVSFEGRRVTYGLDDLDQLDAAYAITCHKSQGSEFPAVVLPLFKAHYMMLRRNLVYTAFTRAKQVLVVVGQHEAMATAASMPGSGQRHGRLTERLLGIDPSSPIADTPGHS